MSSRPHNPGSVRCTKDAVAIVGGVVSISPNMTASIKSVTPGNTNSPSYKQITDAQATVSGTSPGIVTITLPSNNYYPQLLTYGQSLTASVGLRQHYDIRPVNVDPTTGTYQYAIINTSGSGATAVSPPEAVEISFWALVRNTDRAF